MGIVHYLSLFCMKRTSLILQLVAKPGLWLSFLLVGTLNVYAQISAFDSVMQWRNIGPFRGGRCLAVGGHSTQPNTFYFGATGGGVWKTVDAGTSWINVSDGYFAFSSVGALAVAPSDPNVLYVGMGEAEIRGDCATGDGVYRSTDAGATWRHIGLDATAAIGAIAIDPRDERTVFVAALGNPFSPNKERGVFKTTDAGASWKAVLSLDDSTGAIDVQIDPNNPRTLYASSYSARRTPYSMTSGSTRCALWKSTDAGETWQDISQSNGLPKGLKGKICLSPSRAQAGLIWAMIENENGGLFKSNDGGKNWSRVNQDKNIRQRPWYFSRVYADPQNADVVYVLNVGWYRSKDGGKSFQGMSSMHGDHHALWIDPQNPQRMIIGDDGGPAVSYNGGQSWSEQDIPTAQMYHVSVDNQFPYRIYGAQQDNSSVCITSRSSGSSIGTRDWFPAAGGESGYVVAHPKKPWVIFGGNYGGYLERLDTKIEQGQDVSVHPENSIGYGAVDLRERFQWTYPIVFSPHDSSTLYVCSQHVWRSTNEGSSWKRVSNDLTRNDSTKQQASGGPITKDNTGVEVHCTIFTFAESPVKKGVLWAGSDDGLIHVSKDNGQSWTNVSPTNIPSSALISIIEPSSFNDGTAYVAATAYKSGDNKPYLLKTTDFGVTWSFITSGIPANAFTRVIREDPSSKGLLYCGTERGVYCSLNDGQSWESLQYNLPICPIHDLVIHKREGDLIVATHGRAFWILDDLSALRQFRDSLKDQRVHLFKPRHTYLIGNGSYSYPGMNSGTNAPSGVLFKYFLADTTSAEVVLEILDERDSVIRKYSSQKDERGEEKKKSSDFFEEEKKQGGRGFLTQFKGMNAFRWNMVLASVTEVPEAVYWFGGTGGISVPPGRYRARLRSGAHSSIQDFVILKDPRLQTTDADFEAQYDLGKRIVAKAESLNLAINQITEVTKQVNAWSARASSVQDSVASKKLKDLAKRICDSLSAIEKECIQRKAKAGQDALNHPLKLNNKILALKTTVYSADARPTQQAYEVFDDLSARIEKQLQRLRKIISTDIPAFNALIRELDIPAVKTEQSDAAKTEKK